MTTTSHTETAMAPNRVGDGKVEMVEFSAIDPDPNESTTVSIWDSVKANPKVIAYCISMTIGPLIYGYDNIIVGVITAMPAFQAAYGSVYNGELIIPSLWLALWNAFVQVGAMIGSAVNGPLSDRFGRKATFVLASAICFAGVALLYISDQYADADHRRGVFLAGKIVLGISLGLFNSTCQTYVSEVAPSRLRGPLLSFFTFFLILGQLIAISLVFARIAIVGSSAYRVCFASQWAFSGAALIVGIVVPESPTYLVRRGKLDAARKSYNRLYQNSNVEAGIHTLVATLEKESEMHSSTQASRYMDIFKGSDFRRTRIVAYANALQQALGVTLISNASYFLQLAGMDPSKSVLVSQIGIGLGLPANIVSWFAMTILGRRFILLASTSVVGVMWLSIGIAGCFHTSPALWYIGIIIILITVVYNLGVGGAYPVVGAESSSVRLRAYTQGFGFIVNGFFSWLFNFFVPYMFNADEANLGGKMGFFFFGLCVIAVIVVWLEVPEMKNRTFQELDEMFEQKLTTRKFKHYQCVTMNTVVAKSEM